ncbi:hypothetical protein, partial [Thioalkalivibrio sp. HK1]|uniref:hypothetical protein n=1 Tax=Thioalkalivibrio sp. HK1 TaxID=1469245 RepID=UPI00056E37F3
MKRIGKFLFGTVGYARVLGLFAVMFSLSGVSAAQTVNISPNPLAITEGMSGTFTAVLSQNPGAGADVNVAIPATTGLTFNPDFLQFNAGNWNTAETVTVTASQDADQNDESHTISFQVIGGVFSASDFTVSVTDDDKPTSDLVLSAQSLTIGEGSTGTFDVKLSMAPSATVTVTLT